MMLSHIDTFTNQPFSGNPAAVALLERWLAAEQMQQIASELNLAGTAFLVPRSNSFGLRWFAPNVEVALCGHATLAAAHFLWQEEHLALDATAHFETKSGSLSARLDEEDWIWMDFPAAPIRPTDAPPRLASAMGAAPSFVGSNDLDVLALFDHETAVRELTLDRRQLSQIDARGVIATAPACNDADYDFVSRFFAPGADAPEDPVSGSSYCALAPFWAERLGRSALAGRQVSQRGGAVRVRVGNSDPGRVRLGGQAVTVLRSTLCP